MRFFSEWSGAARGPTAITGNASNNTTGGGAVLREFGACGGLALVAARLPRPHAPPPDPPAKSGALHDLDWVKLDDPYEVRTLVNPLHDKCTHAALRNSEMKRNVNTFLKLFI